MTPAWIALAVTAAGVFALAYAAPRARAAEEPPGHRSWQLWQCTPGEACRTRGRPLGRTACLLDLASLTNVLPTGSRVACVHIEEINNGER